MFSGPSLVSVATSLERERAAQPVRVATRASSIPIMSLRPNPHKSWAGSDLVTCSPSIGWELVSPFVADSRQYVAKYQQDRDRTWIAYPGACGKSGCIRTTGQSFQGCVSLSKRSGGHPFMVIRDTIGPNRMGAPRSTRLPAGTLDAERLRGRVIVGSCSLVHFLTLESSNPRTIGRLAHCQEKRWLHSVPTRREFVGNPFPSPIENRSHNTRIAILRK
jgi:hypothetical protein